MYCICWCGVSMDVGGEVVGAAILREKYLKILGQQAQLSWRSALYDLIFHCLVRKINGTSQFRNMSSQAVNISSQGWDMSNKAWNTVRLKTLQVELEHIK